MKLGSRQILFFLAAVAPVGKLVLMPAQLAATSKNDLLFPVLVQLLFQTALVFCVLLLARRQRTFYHMLEEGLGKISAIILSVLFALFLLFTAFMPLMEQKLMVQSVFYDRLPSNIVFAPFFLLSAYLCSRPLAHSGRMWDVLAPLSVFGMLGIFLFSIGEADYGALLPVGAAGLAGFTGGVMQTCAWFFDAALLLPFLGRFDYTKGLAWKGALCYFGGGSVLICFLATFYAVFSDVAVIQTFAFAKMSHFFAGITVLGRIDYLFIFALAFVMLFYTALPVYDAVQLVNDAFHGKRALPCILSTGMNALLLVTMFLLNFQATDVLKNISGFAFWIFPTVTVLCLLLLFLCGRRRHEV